MARHHLLVDTKKLDGTERAEEIADKFNNIHAQIPETVGKHN